jgi:hypothetical protein
MKLVLSPMKTSRMDKKFGKKQTKISPIYTCMFSIITGTPTTKQAKVEYLILRWS